MPTIIIKQLCVLQSVGVCQSLAFTTLSPKAHILYMYVATCCSPNGFLGLTWGGGDLKQTDMT